MKIADIINQINSSLPQGTRLVAVSKYHPAELIQEAYDAGQRIFGESHVQEIQQKYDLLPKDIEWHFIGHLQTNKVKYIAPYISLIHAVDSMRLMEEIEKQGARNQRKIRILLQLHVAQEETKYGMTVEECRSFLEEGEWRKMEHVEICGIMCMASNVDDEEQIAREFEQAHSFFLYARERYFADSQSFAECSMGMSDDYHIAVLHGSTLVRVGSKIFGARSYQ